MYACIWDMFDKMYLIERMATMSCATTRWNVNKCLLSQHYSKYEHSKMFHKQITKTIVDRRMERKTIDMICSDLLRSNIACISLLFDSAMQLSD